MPVRFNHVELTFPRATLTDDFRKDVDAVFVDLFEWRSRDIEIAGINQVCHLLMPDDGQFILLAEGSKHMTSPGYDHLGLLYETRAEVDQKMKLCDALAAEDDRMRVNHYDDQVSPTSTLHFFYFKWLLPIWFDVQCVEPAPGAEPSKRWTYA